MDWFAPHDEYCERLSAAFWAEPLNAVSNFSFIIAAYFAYRLIKQHKQGGWDTYWLATLLFSIGIGSFLYHTFANLWSMLADVIPILIFQISIIGLYGAAIARQKSINPWFGSVSFISAFIVLTWVFAQLPPDTLNGSIGYMSSIISLLVLGIYQYKNVNREQKSLLYAAGLFAVSLVFRTFDHAICQSLPIGTHYLWHITNGCVLFLAVKGYLELIREKKQRSLHRH
ncbi:ceramidase domain-containing protein [Thalassotalea euphylliae]|uniref:ceramidase domain-containing protein n=1 Tax=Thalassotalea euphylliae TaxID=1655234 RepID=UPI00363F9E46